MSIEIEVNGITLKARQGETILQALTNNGIKIPTLCYMQNLSPTGACRICVVEVEGADDLVPACSQPAEEWMRIRTHSPRVVKARKTNVELLLDNHPNDCLYCVRSGNCELQNLSIEHDVRERRFASQRTRIKSDPSSASIIRDPDKCILCGRCVRVCGEIVGVSTLDFIRRGNNTRVGTANEKPLNLSNCISCGQCVVACPTGALFEKSHFPELLKSLHDPKMHTVIHYSPSLSVTLPETLGHKSGKDYQGLINSALKKIGFNCVFDTAFAADLHVMEQAAELQQRIDNNNLLPMFSSCCPSWVKYIEQSHHNLIALLSPCKSPQQMMGSLVKSYYSAKFHLQPESIYSVSVMPCTSKKFEAQREEMTHRGITDVDSVLTTRELARLITLFGIDIQHNEPEFPDPLLGTRSSAGKLFSVSGGLTEALIRTLYARLSGKELLSMKIAHARHVKGRREFRIKMGNKNLGFAVVNGLIHAKDLLNELEQGRDDLHFIEVMTCTGGCVGGGGQPIPLSQTHVKSRTKAVYDIDDQDSIKVSHKNPMILELYRDFLIEPGSDKSKALLHTTYRKREVLQ